MQKLGPFEPDPHIAAAVSGGGDSMALLHLALRWAAGVGGTVTAFTVDHRLRPESRCEAMQVAQWCKALGCRHEILTWQHDHPPSSAVQAQARQARYSLLQQACARHGILHLATAHHADDQAETILMRQQHNSGIEGLAGMPAILALPHMRLLRPLLNVPGERLKQTCRAWGQEWIEDPGNQSMAFERVRVRQALSGVDRPGLDTALAEQRVGLETTRAAFLARALTIFPTGHAALEPAEWLNAAPDVAAAALGEILRTIGNAQHAPDRDSLRRLAEVMARPGFKGATLGGCRLRLYRLRLLVTAEHRTGFAPPLPLAAGEVARWGAFTVSTARPCRVAEIGDHWPRGIARRLPSDIVRAQPGFYDAEGLIAAPTLGYIRMGEQDAAYQARFSPVRAVAGGIFPIVS